MFKSNFHHFNIITMKQVYIIACCLLFQICSLSLYAQEIDLKITPAGIFSGSVRGALELGISEHVGLEFMPGGYFSLFNGIGSDRSSSRGYSLMGNFRYYTKPTERGRDGFYLAPYLRITDGSFRSIVDGRTQDKFEFRRSSAGLMLGAKKIFKNGHWFVDVGGGLGYVFDLKFNDLFTEDVIADIVEDIYSIRVDIPFHLMLGYRFGGSSAK
jgi:hypothetical protein